MSAGIPSDVDRQEVERKARNGLIRSAILWMPFFVVCAGAWVFFTFDRIFLAGDYGSTWFLVVILTIFTFLFGFQAMQPVLDLLGSPADITGYVTRRWARSDSLVMRTHYIRLGRKHIFRIDRTLHGDVKEGDYVRVRYYPHSATVIHLDMVEPPEKPEPEPGGLREELEREAQKRPNRRKEPPARPEF